MLRVFGAAFAVVAGAIVAYWFLVVLFWLAVFIVLKVFG
jgi:hypothetical protein